MGEIYVVDARYLYYIYIIVFLVYSVLIVLTPWFKA